VKVEVKYREAHPKFSYFSGDTGSIRGKYVAELWWDGYISVLFIRTVRSVFRNAFNRLLLLIKVLAMCCSCGL
jgi:hypothetical protein